MSLLFNRETDHDSWLVYYCPGLDWLKVAAQIYQESGFDPNAKSQAGATVVAEFIRLEQIALIRRRIYHFFKRLV